MTSRSYAATAGAGLATRWLCILGLLLGTLVWGTAHAASTSAGLTAAGGRTGRVVVRFKPGAPALRTVEDSNARVTDELDRLSVKVLQPSSEGADALIRRLRKSPHVLYAEHEQTRQLFVVPNDQYYTYQYAHKRIGSEPAWNVSKGSTAVKVAVVDSGMDYTHPDLKDRYAGGYDFVNEDASPADDMGHGTHVAGIIAATGNNGVGVTGVGWYTKILAVKALGPGGGTDADISEAVIWAADNGAAVINMSYGGAYSRVEEDAVKYAQGKGALMVAAMGNEGLTGNARSYPAALPGVIGVAATNQSDQRATFSNYGDYVDISAPGVDILSTYPDDANGDTSDDYGYLSGTSMASPMVAGAAAVIKAKYPTYTAGKLWDRLKAGANDIGAVGRDQYTGYGRLNLYRSITVPSSISGVVRDAQTGAVLSGVRVGIVNTTRATWTDSAGKYGLNGVTVGSVRLKFSKTGYQTLYKTVTVPAGGNVAVNVSLTR